MFGNIILSLGITVLIMIVVDFINKRLNNLKINKINTIIVQSFGVFYLDEKVSVESVRRFNVYVTQRLKSVNIYRRVANLEINWMENEKVKVNYTFIFNQRLEKKLYFEIVKK